MNFLRRVWCEQYEPKRSTLSHETKVQFRPFAVYHIFYNTPMISARFHACGAGPQSRFSNGVSTN